MLCFPKAIESQHRVFLTVSHVNYLLDLLIVLLVNYLFIDGNINLAHFHYLPLSTFNSNGSHELFVTSTPQKLPWFKLNLSLPSHYRT